MNSTESMGSATTSTAGLNGMPGYILKSCACSAATGFRHHPCVSLGVRYDGRPRTTALSG